MAACGELSQSERLLEAERPARRGSPVRSYSKFGRGTA